MAITHPEDSRNVLASEISNTFVAGFSLLILTSSDVLLANFTNPTQKLFSTASNGRVYSQNPVTSPQTVTVAGDIAKFNLRAPNTSVTITGTITALGGGGDLELNSASASVAIGDIIDLGTVAYLAPL